MSLYKYLGEAWKKPSEEVDALWKQRLIDWRKQEATVRVDNPTRLARARTLGYKAKQGVIIVRQRVLKGRRQRPDIKGGRKARTSRRKKVVKISYQVVAEQRANDKYPNCEVLNSYWVASDGKHHWYEIILVDRDSPVVQSDKDLAWLASPKQKGRVYRGLTSAGKKARGMRNKGFGAEKIRPSLNANKGRGN